METHTVNYHLKKVFDGSELEADSVSLMGYNRAEAGKEHKGSATWKDAPKGKIQKFDIIVAYWKNRLRSIFFAVPNSKNNNRIVFSRI